MFSMRNFSVLRIANCVEVITLLPVPFPPPPVKSMEEGQKLAVIEEKEDNLTHCAYQSFFACSSFMFSLMLCTVSKYIDCRAFLKTHQELQEKKLLA